MNASTDRDTQVDASLNLEMKKWEAIKQNEDREYELRVREYELRKKEN